MPGENQDQIHDENRAALDVGSDPVEPAAGRESAADLAPAAEEPERREIPVGSKFADRRAAIYAKARESREPGEGEEEFAPVPADREKMFFGKNTETRSDREARRAEARGEPVAGAEPPVVAEEPAATRHKLKVNGRELELSHEEVIAHAQKSLAAGDILEHAKAVRAENQRVLDELQRARATTSPATSPSSEAQPGDEKVTKPDAAELDQIIERIQVGDRAEAVQALEKYGDLIEQRIQSKIGDLDERIAETTRSLNERDERRRQTMATLDDFGNEFKEFKDSPSLQTALAHETASIMKTHMMAELGVTADTLGSLQQQMGGDELKAISYAYATLQKKGFAVRPHGELLRQAGTTLRERFGVKPQAKPDPQQQPHDMTGRQERKVNMAPQPRRATAMPTADKVERSREEARLQAVRNMRMARRGRA